MINIVVNLFFFIIKEFNINSCFSICSCVGKVNKVPIDVSVLVRNVLSVVSISVTIQIGVSISGEV